MHRATARSLPQTPGVAVTVSRRDVLGGIATIAVASMAGRAARPLSGARLRADPSPGRQLVQVTADPDDRTTAALSTWRWDGRRWRATLPSLPARLGSGGTTAHPTEADGCTPLGTYRIEYAFGQVGPVGGPLPYRQATAGDHWVDDPSSPLYNTWQTGDPAGRWSSAEDLDAYDLAVVFDFNQHPVVPGANSAIFLHSDPVAEPSAGCITLGSVDELAAVVRWLDPAERPAIAIGDTPSRPADPAALDRLLSSGPAGGRIG